MTDNANTTISYRSLPLRFGQSWTRFWFTPSDPIVLSLIRLLIAMVAIWWYLSLYADLQAWFGPNGMLPLSMTKQMRLDELQEERFAFSLLDFVDSASQLWFVYGLGLAALVMMMVGLFTRVATIASLVFVLSFIHRGPMLSRPVDNILAMLLFYLCIGPAGANFSVDAWLRRRHQQREASAKGFSKSPTLQLSSFATVATRMMQIHLVLIYAAMITAQLQAEPWWQGTAVWWMMAKPESRLVDFTGLCSMGQAFEYLVNFFTHLIVLYEACFAVFIWNPLMRPILLPLGVLVWVGIALIGGMVSFAAAMLVATLAFLSPERLRGWCGSGGKVTGDAAIGGRTAVAA